MWKYNDVSLFQAQDLYMAPLCIIVLTMIAVASKRKHRGTVLEQYYMPALFIRFLFAIGYTLVIAFYYIVGDTTFYYQGLTDLRNALSNDPSLWGEVLFRLKLDENSPLYTYFMYDTGVATHAYMLSPSNYMVPKFALPFSFLFNNSYLCICFCLSYFSFAGCWRIFRMFTEMYPMLHRKFAVAALFLPSILFWGGSLLKDSICMGAMGFVLYGLYNILVMRRKIPGSVLSVLVAGFFLFTIKPYILLCLLPSFLLWVFLLYKNRIRDPSVRAAAAVLFGLVILVSGFFLIQVLTRTEVAAQYSSEKIIQTVQGVQGSFREEGAGSNFSSVSITGSPLDLVLSFPLGVISTLFRPFLWEVGSPFMVLSAIEAFLFLLLTLITFRAVSFRLFFRIVFARPVVLFALVYSVLFAGIIGVTTINFGALVRYKIPCIPFYLLTVFIVMHESGRFLPNDFFRAKKSI